MNLPQAAPGPVLDPDRTTARRWAVEELSDRAYVQAQPGLAERAIRRVLEELQALVDRAGGASTGTGLVIGLAVVVVVVVLALLVAGPLRRRVRTSARVGGVFGTVVRTGAEHRSASERAAREGRWDVAVQERFRAIARALEERVVLDVRPGRTADEVSREAGDALPGTAEALGRAARVFDDVTYGGRPGTGGGYRAVAEADDMVRAARPGRLLGGTAAAATPVPS